MFYIKKFNFSQLSAVGGSAAMKCMRPGKCSGAALRPEVAIDTGVLIGKYRSHARMIVFLFKWLQRKSRRLWWTSKALVTELFDVGGWLERRYRKSYRKTPGGSSFSSFTKIPFAEPPLGDLRFCLPVPAKPWEGVRDAGKPCPKPIQNNYVTGKN